MLNPLKILSKFIKSHNQKQLDKLRVILDKVNNFENEISKINDVSIGAHPSFKDLENFGRERMYLSSSEIEKLIIEQYEILQNIAQRHGEKVSHIKPHGALNNMACEDLE